jgi:hypothetical protein
LGETSKQREWNADKLKVAEATHKAILAAVAANDAAHKLDLDLSKKVIANYETTIDIKNRTIAADRAAADRKRLSINRADICAGSTPTATPASAGAADGQGGSEQVELPTTIERGLRDLAEDADRQVAAKDAKIAALQQWAVDHGFAEASKP